MSIHIIHSPLRRAKGTKCLSQCRDLACTNYGHTWLSPLYSAQNFSSGTYKKSYYHIWLDWSHDISYDLYLFESNEIFWIFAEFFEIFKANFENYFLICTEKHDYCLIGLDPRCGMAIFRFPLKICFWWCYLVHVSEHISEKRLVIFSKKRKYLLIELDSGHVITIFGFALKFRFQWCIHVHIW